MFWIDLKNVQVPHVRQEHLLGAFETLRRRVAVGEQEQEALERFTRKFVTCSLDPEKVGEEAVKIAKEVNWHGHSQSCRKNSAGGKCRFNFPKYPLPHPVFVDANKVFKEGERLSDERRNYILKKVMSVLVELENGKMVVSKTVKRIMEEKKPGETIKQRIRKLLEIASNMEDEEEEEEINQGGEKRGPKRSSFSFSFSTTNNKTFSFSTTNNKKAPRQKPISLDEYGRAVIQQPRKGSTVLLERDLDEVFMNN